MKPLTIIVPYRDRPDHLSLFTEWMTHHVPDIPIAIIEQAPGKPFNRAKLLNIGALQFPSTSFVMHDIDMLPVKYKYSTPAGTEVVQLAKSDIQVTDYLGGVTLFTSHIFHKIGGYHNDYFHRAEDNEMMFNLRRMDIPVYTLFQQFRQLPHPRSGKEFDQELWVKAQKKRNVQNQLAHCEYKVIDNNKLNKNIIRLTVEV